MVRLETLFIALLCTLALVILIFWINTKPPEVVGLAASTDKTLITEKLASTAPLLTVNISAQGWANNFSDLLNKFNLNNKLYQLLEFRDAKNIVNIISTANRKSAFQQETVHSYPDKFPSYPWSILGLAANFKVDHDESRIESILVLNTHLRRLAPAGDELLAIGAIYDAGLLLKEKSEVSELLKESFLLRLDELLTYWGSVVPEASRRQHRIHIASFAHLVSVTAQMIDLLSAVPKKGSYTQKLKSLKQYLNPAVEELLLRTMDINSKDNRGLPFLIQGKDIPIRACSTSWALANSRKFAQISIDSSQLDGQIGRWIAEIGNFQGPLSRLVYNYNLGSFAALLGCLEPVLTNRLTEALPGQDSSLTSKQREFWKAFLRLATRQSFVCESLNCELKAGFSPFYEVFEGFYGSTVGGEDVRKMSLVTNARVAYLSSFAPEGMQVEEIYEN